jgi:hypothetical protein
MQLVQKYYLRIRRSFDGLRHFDLKGLQLHWIAKFDRKVAARLALGHLVQ